MTALAWALVALYLLGVASRVTLAFDAVSVVHGRVVALGLAAPSVWRCFARAMLGRALFFVLLPSDVVVARVAWVFDDPAVQEVLSAMTPQVDALIRAAGSPFDDDDSDDTPPRAPWQEGGAS